MSTASPRRRTSEQSESRVMPRRRPTEESEAWLSGDLPVLWRLPDVTHAERVPEQPVTEPPSSRPRGDQTAPPPSRTPAQMKAADPPGTTRRQRAPSPDDGSVFALADWVASIGTGRIIVGAILVLLVSSALLIRRDPVHKPEMTPVREANKKDTYRTVTATLEEPVDSSTDSVSVLEPKPANGRDSRNEAASAIPPEKRIELHIPARQARRGGSSTSRSAIPGSSAAAPGQSVPGSAAPPISYPRTGYADALSSERLR